MILPDLEFEARAREMLRNLLAEPPQGPEAPMLLEAAVNALDVARVECHRRRLQAIVGALSECVRDIGGPEEAEALRGLPDKPLREFMDRSDEDVRLIERLGSALGAAITADATIGELLA